MSSHTSSMISVTFIFPSKQHHGLIRFKWWKLIVILDFAIFVRVHKRDHACQIADIAILAIPLRMISDESPAFIYNSGSDIKLLLYCFPFCVHHLNHLSYLSNAIRQTNMIWISDQTIPTIAKYTPKLCISYPPFQLFPTSPHSRQIQRLLPAIVIWLLCCKEKGM